MDKNRWDKDILNSQGIEKLFKEVGINDHKYIGINSCYTFNDNQHGVFVRTENKSTNYQDQIIIDVTQGEPSWSQMTEVICGIGTYCSKRIIIYDGDETSDDSSSGGIVASCISEFANLSGLPTYLVHLDPDTHQFNLVVEPESNNEGFSRRISKRKLQELEFWAIYYGFEGMHGRLLHYPEDWNKNRVFHSHWLDYYTTWEDDGVYIHTEEISDEGSYLLNELTDDLIDKIRERYPNCEIKMNEDVYAPNKLSIRVWDEPFQSFLNSNCRQRYLYGEDVFSLEVGFRDYIIPVFEEYISSFLDLDDDIENEHKGENNE